MMSLIGSLGVWNWFILGGILLVLEILLPGTFMLWLGLSALLVGLLALVLPLAWQLQWILFAVFALASIPIWRRIGRRVEHEADQPFLNRRADSFIGQVFTLEQPIVAGVGTIRVGDTVWRISGPDCPAGSRIKVARTDGALLVVEAA